MEKLPVYLMKKPELDYYADKIKKAISTFLIGDDGLSALTPCEPIKLVVLTPDNCSIPGHYGHQFKWQVKVSTKTGYCPYYANGVADLRKGNFRGSIHVVIG